MGMVWMTSLLVVVIVVTVAIFWLRRPQRLMGLEFARQRLAAGARVNRATLSDGELVYLKAGRGSGVPRLYVHGFTGMKENWLALMARMGPTCVQFAPDLPGWGESARDASLDYGYAAQAKRLAEFIDQVIGEPVDLVGHSMGGGIAAVLAARYPDKVRRLVLMSAAGVRFADNTFGLAVLEGKNPFAVTDVASLQDYFSQVFERPPWLPRTIMRWMVQRRRAEADFELAVLNSIGRGKDAFLPEREAARISAPTLLLWCRGDRIVDASSPEIYAALISDSRIVLVDGTGHMPMMENTAATVAALKEFMQ